MPLRTSEEITSFLDKLRMLVRSRLWAQIVVGMILGITVGLLLSPSGGGWLEQETAEAVAGWLGLPGQIFLALIQMVVIPLVLSSIILGITSSGNIDYLKRIGPRIGLYFVMTTTVAVVIGTVIVSIIKPGKSINQELVAQMTDSNVATPTEPEREQSTRSVPEQIVELIPVNPFQSALDRSMLQIVVLAILSAIALMTIETARAKPLLEMAESLQELSMKVVSWAMMLAPYAVFGLLAQITTKIGLDALLGMSVYVGTVVLGLFVLTLFYLLVVAVVAKRNPLKFLASIREVQLLAFSTSSSAAVMPLSMQTAEEKLNVQPSISQFLIPLGATVNMDGTALYQVIAAVFLTQVFGIPLSTGDLILLTITTVGASIGSPSTPGVGIVILATIVQGIGVPPAGIALILGVDRILDMTRTSVNVTGDLAACVVLDRWVSAPESVAPSGPASV